VSFSALATTATDAFVGRRAASTRSVAREGIAASSATSAGEDFPGARAASVVNASSRLGRLV
jgi:hypothetical protein